MCPLARPPTRPPRTAPKAASGARDEATALSALVGTLMGHVHRRSAGDTLAILNEAGLTMAQLVSLHCLAQAGTRTITGIAETLHLSPAATSHLVDRLVQAGLVERREDPEDRRQKRIGITPAGAALVDRVQDERTQEFARVLARLSPALRRRFSAVLMLVNRELASLPEEKSP